MVKRSGDKNALKGNGEALSSDGIKTLNVDEEALKGNEKV